MSGNGMQSSGKKGMLHIWGWPVLVCALMFVLSTALLGILSVVAYRLELAVRVIEIGIMLVYLLSGLAGGLLLGRIKKRKRFLWGMTAGAGYFLIILVVSLIMNGGQITDMVHFLAVLALCLSSGMIGGMLS